MWSLFVTFDPFFCLASSRDLVGIGGIDLADAGIDAVSSGIVLLAHDGPRGWQRRKAMGDGFQWMGGYWWYGELPKDQVPMVPRS